MGRNGRKGCALGSNIKGVLFDLDGTLIDSHDLILASFRYATREVLGQDIPDEVLMQKVGQPLAVQMWDFTSDEAVHDELLQVYRDHNERVHDELIRSFSGVREALRTLRDAGVPMGVVTSKMHSAARRGLESCGLGGYFPILVGSDDWPEHKPEPGPVLYGCKLLSLPASTCLYVGDSPFDMRAGNAAGCMTAAATWGMFPADELRAEHPDYECESMENVVQTVLG